MSRSYLDPPVPVVALATVPGVSALAVVRVSGRGCFDLFASCFSRKAKLLSAPGHSLVHGAVLDPSSGEEIDEVLVGVFRAPASPTGEDQLDISCHGSPVVVRRLLALLEDVGFARALPGEFTFRAFAYGKKDLVSAEAVEELVSAPGDAARAEALAKLGGGLSRRLESTRSEMLGLLAEAEVRLDYAEEDGSPSELFPAGVLREFRDDLASLSSTWSVGRLHAEGLRVVIAGSANAGKSSLFNLLAKEERAIVSSEPGTTRDWIEIGFEIGGVPVRLVDTAGLRETEEGVEAVGMERSRSLAVDADVVICLADGTRGLGPADRELLSRRADSIRVWNKMDLPAALSPPQDWLPVSALDGRGIADLLSSLEARIRSLEGAARSASRRASSSDFVVSNPRQKRLLDRAVGSLDQALSILEIGATEGRGLALDALALELRDAADAIGELTGEIASAEILETVFSGFCLGK